MASKTKIKSRIKNKTNPELQESIRLALKHKPWMKIAQILSASTRRYSSVNLKEIERETREGDIVIVPGKVLSSGNITKKIRICAISISVPARSKLKETKSEFAPISDEIRKNPKAEGIKIIN